MPGYEAQRHTGTLSVGPAVLLPEETPGLGGVGRRAIAVGADRAEFYDIVAPGP